MHYNGNAAPFACGGGGHMGKSSAGILARLAAAGALLKFRSLPVLAFPGIFKQSILFSIVGLHESVDFVANITMVCFFRDFVRCSL